MLLEMLGHVGWQILHPAFSLELPPDPNVRQPPALAPPPPLRLQATTLQPADQGAAWGLSGQALGRTYTPINTQLTVIVLGSA